jgi:hypothetical protein
MLPGLVLTAALLAQSAGTPSLAALAHRAPHDSRTPRFVNIGDRIIQSSTAEPVAPAAVCVPAAAPVSTQSVEREVVVLPVAVSETAEPPVETVQQPVDELSGLLFFPAAASVFPSRTHPHVHSRPAPEGSGARTHAVTLPPFPTVLLPPFPTVLLPAQPAVPRAR